MCKMFLVGLLDKVRWLPDLIRMGGKYPPLFDKVMGSIPR